LVKQKPTLYPVPFGNLREIFRHPNPYAYLLTTQQDLPKLANMRQKSVTHQAKTSIQPIPSQLIRINPIIEYLLVQLSRYASKKIWIPYQHQTIELASIQHYAIKPICIACCDANVHRNNH